MTKPNPLPALRRHLAACIPLLAALQPTPDADDRTRQEWAALWDAVKRARVCAWNLGTESKEKTQ